MKKIKFLLLLILGVLLLAACGETVTVAFDSNSDEVVASVEAKVGKSMELPSPEREGYTLDGWFKDAELTVEFKATDKVEGEMTLYAKWSPKKYDVIFMDGTTELAKQSVEYGQKATNPTVQGPEGYGLAGWYTDSGLTKAFDLDTAVTEEIKLYAKWAKNVYTVKFMVDAEEYKKVTVEHGGAAETPAAPTKEGHEFLGWDRAYDNITKDLIVFAEFEILSYTVKFMSDDVQIGEDQVVEYGSDATAPATPIKDGYVFEGWDVDFTNVSSDLVVNAKWESIKFTVTFLSKSGMPMDTQEIKWGEDATAPTPIPVTGYTFKEWNQDFTNVTENLVVQSLYDAIVYDIEYYNGTTKLDLTPATYTIEDDVTLPVPEIEGFLFNGWYKNDDFTDTVTVSFEKGVSGDLKFYAEAFDLNNTAALAFELNDGTWSWTVDTVTAPAAGIKSKSTLPVIFMQDFYWWLKNNNLLESTGLNANLVAKNWAEFSVNKDDPEALYNWATDAAYGGGYTTPTGYNQFWMTDGSGDEATGEIFDVIGGFLGEEGYKEKYQTVTQHIAYLLKAKYTESINSLWLGKSSYQAAAFIWDGYLYGTQGLTSDVVAGWEATFVELRTVIPTPTKGYHVVNKALVEYTVDYVKSEVVIGPKHVLPIPSRVGYFFGGWYDNPELNGDPIVSIAKGETPAAKYYAQWIAVTGQ